MNLEKALQLVRDVPDFPKPGIIFRDITPILENAEAFQVLISAMAELVRSLKIQKVMAIESRGFLFGAPLALALEAGFVMVRKKGKLPRPTVRAKYALEYGEDEIEMHQDSLKAGERVLLLDDDLATGGTLAAARELCLKQGAKPVGALVLIELLGLRGASRLEGLPLSSLIRYN